MIVIETCPECGSDLQNYVITCYPPTPVKYCPHCGWRYEDISNEIIRVPFTPPSTNADRIRSGSNNDIHHIIMWWINNGKSFTNTSLALKEWLKQPNGV